MIVYRIHCRVSMRTFFASLSFASPQSALTWDVSSRGLLLTTSSCAHAMDLNTPPMATLSVDLPLFHLPLPTVMLPKMARSCSPPGLKMTSVPDLRDGGTKHCNLVLDYSRFCILTLLLRTKDSNLNIILKSASPFITNRLNTCHR